MVPVYPEIRNVLNPEEALREMNDMLGNPQKLLRGPEEVKQLEQQQQQAQAQQQQQEAIERGTQTANVGAQAAQILSNTNVGAGQNALSAVIGNA
jgi:hypothetical protein